jgi:hypothetical protein
MTQTTTGARTTVTATNSPTPERPRPRATPGVDSTGHRCAGLFLRLVAVLAVTLTSGCGAPAGNGRPVASSSDQTAFAWFRPGPAPAGWKDMALPGGTAVLSIPPDAVAAESDPGTVSATITGPNGDVQLYLNATPQQGEEAQASWTEFRLHHLTGEHAAAATRLSSRGEMFFRGGTGACVADTYVTRVGAHRYQEIACLVTGACGSSVLVVAAPSSSWDLQSSLLEQAVDSYLVR